MCFSVGSSAHTCKKQSEKCASVNKMVCVSAHKEGLPIQGGRQVKAATAQ